MNGMFQWLPRASSNAGRTDTLMLALTLICGAMVVLLLVLIVGFCIRYRQGSKANRDNVPVNAKLVEVAWTVSPLILFIAICGWAAYDYIQLYRWPANAMPVFVVAKQWMWKLEHGDGRQEINELHVPLGQPVHLIMASQDVIHSFFVPAFRIKQDVVPGRYTSLAFTATRLGSYDLFCAEYCGSEHSLMRGRIVVMTPADYARWLAQQAAQPDLAARGAELFRRYGCSGCHSAQSTVRAPSLARLAGTVVHLQDGRSVLADENYLRDSVLEPRKDIVAGYAPVMPSYAGQIGEEDLAAIIAYLQGGGPHDDSH